MDSPHHALGEGNIGQQRVSLLDGTTATVRPLTSTDYDSVVELADTLSDEERYLRFFTAHPSYIAEWAASLTTPVPDAVALGAYDHGELVGVADFVPLRTPGQAEVAVVVARYQHDRGVATALLRDLIGVAKRRGYRHLVADVLTENSGMCHVINGSHLPVTVEQNGSVLKVDIDLSVVSQDQ